MFILALYPGAGETFVSHVFDSLLDADIRTFDNIQLKDFIDYTEAGNKIIKTSVLPEEFPVEILERYKVIYLVRDGRDCILNNAHYRKNVLNIDSDLNQNIEESILAADGSFFGGWSKHVESWISRADYVLKFEDFIENPVASLQSINKTIEISQIKDVLIEPYNSQTWGDHMDADCVIHSQIPAPRSWEIELTAIQKELFLKLHADTLMKLGYSIDNDFCIDHIAHMFPDLYLKMGKDIEVSGFKKYTILVEASKLQMNYNDGVKRYVIELLKSVHEILKYNSRYKVDVFDGDRILSIQDLDLDYYLKKEHSKESLVSRIKQYIVYCIKETLKFFLSISQYNSFGLAYKSIKAKIFRGKLFASFQEGLFFIQKNVFKEKIQFTKPALEINMSAYDLVHIPLLQDVEYINEAREKALITLHDLTHLSHPHFHDKDNIVLADHGLKLCMKYNANFLTISESTKQDLNDYKDIYQHVDVVYEAADHKIFYPMTSLYWKQNIRAMFGMPNHARYFLSLSTLEPRKNLKNAIIAFQEALPDLPDDVYFVIAGKEGWKMNDVLPHHIELSDRIIFTGFVKEEYLPWLYREALALVYISHYEGFGLPLLESMSCGRPVVFGNNSSMIEIVGDTGYPVETENIESIKFQLLQVINDPELLSLKSLRALKRSNDFSWQRTGLKTLSIYEKYINRSQVEFSLKEKNVHI